VNRTFRGTLVALVALALAVSAPLDATAVKGTRILPPPDRSHGEFTRGEALAVLAKARRQLHPDTRRLRARRPVGHGPATDLTMTLRDLFLARSMLTGADRRDADALLSRSRVSFGSGEDPITTDTPAVQCSTNFCVHYRPAGMSESATTTWVQTTLATLEHVRAYETRTLGYRPPISDAPATPSTDNPDGRFDVFLGNLAQQGLYGYCSPDDAQPRSDGRAAAFCVLDNDYAYAEYGTAPLNSLRATAAHEFFHTIQFAYDVYEDIWFMEGTATWIEDEVYDSINDNYQYLADSPIRQPRRAVDYSIGLHRYGSFLFFKYAAERFRSPSIVRQFWEYADAPRNRYSLQAIRAVLAVHRTSWPAFFSVFGSWNALPGLTYSEGTRYPTPAFLLSKTLAKRGKRARSTGWRTVSLPHLSNSAVRVAPSPRLSPRKKLLIEVNAPDTARGGTALIQRRYRNGAVGQSMMPLNAYGNGRLLVRFNRRVLASVAVVVSNTSTVMRDCGAIGDGYGGPVYSCYGRGYYDQGQNFATRLTLR
jgi:hypothetical protein